MSEPPMPSAQDPTGIAIPDRVAIARVILAQLGQAGTDDGAGLNSLLAEILGGVSDAELAQFVDRIATTGGDWGHHPCDPTARRLGRAVMAAVLEPGSELVGAERLAGVGGRPLIIAMNHLSFADANVLEHLLATTGREDIARHLAVVVGPKVFSAPLRRLASLCFGSIKVPQSSSRASGEAVMSPREVARVAAEVLRTANARLDAADHLVIFVEGTRSRSGAMQRALAGVARYFSHERLCLVPAAIEGSERLVPLGETETLHPTRVVVRIGRPIDAAAMLQSCGRNRGLAMDVVGLRIAAELSPPYRGAYAEDAPDLARARAIEAQLA